MRRVVFSILAGLVAVLCFLPVTQTNAGVAACYASEARAEDDAEGVFSADARDWHSVVIDLESSALVRIYGRIAPEMFPTDIAVGVSEHLSSISAWIGDSGGNRVVPAQTDRSADRYLVIEGKAASADVAGAASVHFISYKIDGSPKIQFVNIPVQTRAAAAASTDDAGGSSGCDAGTGLAVAGIAFAVHALLRRHGRD